MLEFVVFCVLHCIMSFITKYCYDTVELWNLKETPPQIKMPSLYDLNENSSKYTQQQYVEQIILPSHDYFSKVSDINKFQDCINLGAFLCITPTFLLVAMAFPDFDFPKVLEVIISILLPSLITLVVCLIYNCTGLKLKTFELTGSDLKKIYNPYSEFELTESSKQNNFYIEMHSEYVARIYSKISNRYRVRAVLEVLCGVYYLLVIKRFPD